MTDKRFRDLDSTGTLNAGDIFAIEQGGNSRRISASLLRTFTEAGTLATHIASTTAHGISTYMATLLDSTSSSDLLDALGFALSGSESSGSFSFGGRLVLTWKDFTATTGTQSVSYGDGHTYSSWARAWMAGDDSNTDVSTAVVGWNTSAASVYSHAEGSVSCVLFAIGV